MSYDDNDPQAFLKHLHTAPAEWPGDEMELEGEGETDDVLPPIKKPSVPVKPSRDPGSLKSSGSVTSTTSASGKKGKGKGKKRRKKRLRINVNLEHCKYDVVHQNAKQMSWKAVPDDEPWDIWWTDVSVAAERLARMNKLQKINHWPCMTEICRKDKLAMNMNRMRRQFEKAYNFVPQAWVLPGDYDDLVSYAKKNRGRTYIAKPDAGCQGKGIYLTKSVSDIDPGENVVVQQYMTKPLLVDGLKFDLRIYALVISIDPLRIYLYKDGLARFCTELYKPPTGDNVEDAMMHLSNYAINKHSDKFHAATDADSNTGHKRSILAVFKALEEQGIDTEKLWSRIADVITKTVISVQPLLAHVYKLCQPEDSDGSSCFEILGFDVLLDKKCKPYLVEVNHSPSFNTDTPLDKQVKEGLIHDTIRMVNIDIADKRKFILEERAKLKRRLYSKGKKTKDQKQEDMKAKQASRESKLAARLQHELNHAGGYSLIYPVPDRVERFSKYFVPFAPAMDRKKKKEDDGKPKSAFGSSIPKKPGTAGSGSRRTASSSKLPATGDRARTPSATPGGPSKPGTPSSGLARRSLSSKSINGAANGTTTTTDEKEERMSASRVNVRRQSATAGASRDSVLRGQHSVAPDPPRTRLADLTSAGINGHQGKGNKTPSEHAEHDVSMCEDLYCQECSELGVGLPPTAATGPVHSQPRHLYRGKSGVGGSDTRGNTSVVKPTLSGRFAVTRGSREGDDAPYIEPQSARSPERDSYDDNERDEAIRRMIRRASTGNVLTPGVDNANLSSYRKGATAGRSGQRSTQAAVVTSPSRVSRGHAGDDPAVHLFSDARKRESMGGGGGGGGLGSNSESRSRLDSRGRNTTSNSYGDRDRDRISTQMAVYDKDVARFERYAGDLGAMYDDIPSSADADARAANLEYEREIDQDYDDLFARSSSRQQPGYSLPASSSGSIPPSDSGDYGHEGNRGLYAASGNGGGSPYGIYNSSSSSRGIPSAGASRAKRRAANRSSAFGRAIQNDRPPIGDLAFNTSFPYKAREDGTDSRDSVHTQFPSAGANDRRPNGSSVSIPSSSFDLGGSGLVISSLPLQAGRPTNARHRSMQSSQSSTGSRGSKGQGVSFPRFNYQNGNGAGRSGDRSNGATWKRSGYGK